MLPMKVVVFFMFTLLTSLTFPWIPSNGPKKAIASEAEKAGSGKLLNLDDREDTSAHSFAEKRFDREPAVVGKAEFAKLIKAYEFRPERGPGGEEGEQAGNALLAL